MENSQPLYPNTEVRLVRERQWIYLGPSMAAPLTHICVTLYRGAKTPLQKQILFGGGIIGATNATIGMRLYLMAHAGYPGEESTQDRMTAKEQVFQLQAKLHTPKKREGTLRVVSEQ